MKEDFIPAFNDNMQHHMLFSEDAAILPVKNEPTFTRESKANTGSVVLESGINGMDK